MLSVNDLVHCRKANLKTNENPDMQGSSISFLTEDAQT